MSHRPAINLALFSLLVFTAAACDLGPQDGHPAGSDSPGGLIRQPVRGTFTRFTRRSATGGWTLQRRGSSPGVITLSTTWCAPPRSMFEHEVTHQPPAPLMDTEHVTEVLLERSGALRCLAQVEGLDEAFRSAAPATVRFVRNAQTGRIEGALSVVGRDQPQDLEVRLVVEFAADGQKHQY